MSLLGSCCAPNIVDSVSKVNAPVDGGSLNHQAIDFRLPISDITGAVEQTVIF